MHRPLPLRPNAVACETPRKLRSRMARRQTRRVVYVLAVLVLVATSGVHARTHADATVAAPADAAQAHAGGAPSEGAEEGGRGLVDVIARVVNFGILAGTLFYL